MVRAFTHMPQRVRLTAACRAASESHSVTASPASAAKSSRVSASDEPEDPWSDGLSVPSSAGPDITGIT